MKTLCFCAGAQHADLSILNTIHVDILVGVDAGAHILQQHGFNLDLAVGDFDSSPLPLCRQCLILPREKDDTDLEAALLYILYHETPENIEKIIILGALGVGRLDHLLNNIWLVQQPRFQQWVEKFYFVERGNTVRFYRAGKYIIKKEEDKKYLSFIGLTPIRQLSLRGVYYPLNNCDYSYPMALISNEFIGSEMEFTFKSGLMCVVQSCDVM